MGPDAPSDSMSDGFMNMPLKCIAGNTFVVQSREALRSWIKMIYKIALSDQKTKGALNDAGHQIYLACEKDTQCIHNQVELGRELDLNGS